MGAALDRFAPGARLAYYAGHYFETEGSYLLQRRVDVEFGWGPALGPSKSAVEQRLVHASSYDPANVTARTLPENRYDLCFLSFPSEDETARAAPGGQRFDAATLPTIRKALRHGGMLLYQGRTGGINIAYEKRFPNWLQGDLAAAGFELAEAFYLKEAPGIFFFAASSAAGSWKERPTPEGFRFFVGTGVDNLAVRFWPRAREAAAMSGEKGDSVPLEGSEIPW